MTGALSDPFDGCHMGVTAENVATDYHVSREDQDALAAESHRRAAAATAAGYFKEQMPADRDPRQEGQDHHRRHRRAHTGGRQPG
jgi:Acetyl-CoA acetyltransferase